MAERRGKRTTPEENETETCTKAVRGEEEKKRNEVEIAAIAGVAAKSPRIHASILKGTSEEKNF